MFLETRAIRCVRAAAEAMFPENDIDAPTGEDTSIVPRTIAFFAELPARERRKLLLLFVCVEWAAVFATRRLRTFSRLSIAERARLLERFLSSDFYVLRLVGYAFKGTMTMIYLSSPMAVAFLERTEPAARVCEGTATRVPEAARIGGDVEPVAIEDEPARPHARNTGA